MTSLKEKSLQRQNAEFAPGSAIYIAKQDTLLRPRKTRWRANLQFVDASGTIARHAWLAC